jgi:hypothetical protein
MHNDRLDAIDPLPLPVNLAIGVLGLLVTALGVAHGMAAFARYHARPQR